MSIVTGKERDDHDQQHLGRQIVTEPENEDRRERDLRHVLKQHDQRIKRAAEPLETHDDKRDRDADDRRQHEAEQHLNRRRLRGDRKLRPAFHQRNKDGAGCRQHERGHLEQTDRHFPHNHDSDREGDRRHELLETAPNPVYGFSGQLIIDDCIVHARPRRWLSIRRLRSRASAAVKAGSK